MSKFRKEGKSSGPAMNTASLPDIVFMLLFFFMVATTAKENDPAVKVTQPDGKRAVDLTPYKQRSEIDFLYLGSPRNKSRWSKFMKPGDKVAWALSLDNVVQASEDDLYTVNTVSRWKRDKYASKPTDMKKDIKDVITCVKADKSAPTGLIFEIREALEKIDALTIAYAVKDNGIGKD